VSIFEFSESAPATGAGPSNFWSSSPASAAFKEKMSRTPARITQADVARAIRAAKQAGAGSVRILQDGTIQIDLAPRSGEKSEKPVEPEREIIL
jgi:hypothetical protein